MKKKLALLLASVMAIGMLAGCGGAPASTASTATSGGTSTATSTEGGTATATSDLQVDVFYYDFSDVYISSVRTAMDEQLKAMGIEPKNWDAAGSQPTQDRSGQDRHHRRFRPADREHRGDLHLRPAKDIVEAARAADIPVIFFNREVADNDVINSYEKCAFVGTNAPDAGHMQGEMIGEYLLANYDAVDLNGDGTISYVLVQGPGRQRRGRSPYPVRCGRRQQAADRGRQARTGLLRRQRHHQVPGRHRRQVERPGCQRLHGFLCWALTTKATRTWLS